MAILKGFSGMSGLYDVSIKTRNEKIPMKKMIGYIRKKCAIIKNKGGFYDK